MASHIGRREFLATLGGAAAAWPLAARGQQAEKMRRIGVLTTFAADDPTGQTRLLAFAQALAQVGWTDGRNVRIDLRWGAGDPERNRKYAAELVALAPDVILTAGSGATGPLLQATRAVPVVFVQVAIRSARALSTAWRGRAETPPVLLRSNTRSAENGSNCSKRSPPAQGARRSCAVSLPRRDPASSARSRPRPHRSAWRSARSTLATPGRSSAPSWHSRARRLAA
jgi:hypothetical protein